MLSLGEDPGDAVVLKVAEVQGIENSFQVLWRLASLSSSMWG